ncbi:Phenylalanine--tRNA ligase [Gracilaria domingensis]|nr:Phenylalanine--tRNA ligase [Gracilaria domingensis]
MGTCEPAFVGSLIPCARSCSYRQKLLCSTFTQQRLRPGVVTSRRAHSQAHTLRASATDSLVESEAKIKEQVEKALQAIGEAKDKKEVEQLRVAFLGKKGSITGMLKLIGKLPATDRPKYGAAVNKAKEAVAAAITERKQFFESSDEDDDDDWIDVTMPGIRPRNTVGRIHPLNSTMDIAIEIFQNIGYQVIDDPDLNREIETDYYCFEALNCPADHPARDMQDTFYLNEEKTLLLRTQTSSVQIRFMEKNKPPFRIIAPGRVFRRDTVDATHSPVFHQIEILAIEKMGVLTLGDLKGTIEHFLKKMLGDNIETRFRGSYFPFTEPSMEVDVFFRGKWMEVLGCGMVDPAVLENVGIDPAEWCGFAAGFGVERFAMAMYGIADIREFYKNDVRFLRQGLIDIDKGIL